MGWHYWKSGSGHIYRDKGDGMRGWSALPRAAGEKAYRAQESATLMETLTEAQREAQASGFESLQVWVVTRSIAKSGMSRIYDFYVIRSGSLWCVTYPLAVVCGLQMHKDHGLIVRGCNTDLAHDTVYNALHAIGQPSYRFEIRRI